VPWEARKLAREMKMGHRWQVGAEGNGMEEKKQGGRELRKLEWKLRGIWEQQEARDTIVARLKNVEVRKTVEAGCRGVQGRKQGVEWETRGGPDTRRTRDGRWGFAQNQSGRKDGLSAAKSDWVS